MKKREKSNKSKRKKERQEAAAHKAAEAEQKEKESKIARNAAEIAELKMKMQQLEAENRQLLAPPSVSVAAKPAFRLIAASELSFAQPRKPFPPPLLRKNLSDHSMCRIGMDGACMGDHCGHCGTGCCRAQCLDEDNNWTIAFERRHETSTRRRQPTTKTEPQQQIVLKACEGGFT